MTFKDSENTGVIASDILPCTKVRNKEKQVLLPKAEQAYTYI